MPWVSICQQSLVWEKFFDRVVKVPLSGLAPVVCVDLDLTSLLAPQKSREVLDRLRAHAGEIDKMANVAPDTFARTLDEIWRNAEPALLPGYTSTSIQAYGVYCTAQLQARTGHVIDPDHVSRCEEFITNKVHSWLRDGYWDRDLADDLPATGFSQWAGRVAEAGARVVFLSNRDPATREASLASIRRMLGEAVEPFAFFGPGGSMYDASSKATAITLLEQGIRAGVHYGKAENGRVEYLEVAPGTPSYTVVAIIDDRAENRRRVIEASTVSAARLEEKGIGAVMDIASAAEGFCPEMDVVGMPMVISSFAFKEGT